MRKQTVGYLKRGTNGTTEVLLGERDSTFCNGIWSGPGGNFEDGEDMLACLVREFQEEIGVEVERSSAIHIATIDYYHLNGSAYQLGRQVHFFDISKWSGEPHPVEGFHRLEWFPILNLPFDQMHKDIRLWLPMVIDGVKKVLEGAVYYSSADTTVVADSAFRFVDR